MSSRDSSRVNLQNIVNPDGDMKLKFSPNELLLQPMVPKQNLSFFNPRRSFAATDSKLSANFNQERKASVSLSNIMIPTTDSPSSKLSSSRKFNSNVGSKSPKKRESRMEEITDKLLKMEKGPKVNKKQELVEMRNKDVDSLSHSQLLEVKLII